MHLETAQPRETISVRSSRELLGARNPSLRDLKLVIPRHWRPLPEINPLAARVEAETLDWFTDLGFGDRALRIIKTFWPAQYAGLPFPTAGFRELFLVARYLSLWLLWDDIDVERRERGFRIRPDTVLATAVPVTSTLCDHAWARLFRELAETRSLEWLCVLAGSMDTWSDAALRETIASKRGLLSARPCFREALRSRINTIGTYPTAYLLEYILGRELPRAFHEHSMVRELKTLAGKIVGLGNDIFSLGKDWTSGYVNVAFAYRDERGCTMREAIFAVVREHNEAVRDFDRVARLLPSFGRAWDEPIAEWLRLLRYSCFGFTVWESRAPRYAALKMLIDGALVAPVFVAPEEAAS